MTIVENRPDKYAIARKAMVDSQLRPSGINAEFVLKRMGVVPREDFVPESDRNIAYIDRAVPLGNGRYLAPPVAQGAMLEAALPLREDKALVVDGGSGYLAELLRPLVASLDMIDPPAAFRESPAEGGYTLLMIDGAIEQMPDTLVRQLADDGRVVTGLVKNELTRVAFGRKAAGHVALLPLAEMGIPILPEFALPRAWSF